jgi:hypothetical protein
MGIHFLRGTHGGERMVSSDVVWDVFLSTTRDVKFHVLHGHIYIHLLFAFQYSCQWVDIVVLVDGV